jgi:hypothetical protein
VDGTSGSELREIASQLALVRIACSVGVSLGIERSGFLGLCGHERGEVCFGQILEGADSKGRGISERPFRGGVSRS